MRGTRLRRLAAVLLTFLLLSLPAGCVGSGEETLDIIRASGVLRVAIVEDGGRYSRQTADGQWEGIEVSLARAIAEDLGLELRLVPVEVGELTAALQSRADLALGRLASTASLRKSFSTSISYMNGSLYAVTPRGVYFPTLNIFEGEVTGVSELVSEAYLLDIKGAGISTRSYQSTANVSAALLDRSIAAYFCYEEQAEQFLQDPELQVQTVAQLQPEEYVAVAPAGSRNLIREVNNSITRMLEDGRLAQLQDSLR